MIQEDCLKSATHASWVFDKCVCLSEPCFLRHNTELKCRSPMCGLLVEPQSFPRGTYIWPQSIKKMSKIGQNSMKKWPFLPLSCHEWQVTGLKKVFTHIYCQR